MSICIIVDGYSAGKQFAKALLQRGYNRCIHVQSTPYIITALSKFEESDYIANVIYKNNINELINNIKEVAGAEEILCVIAGSEPGVTLADLLSEKLALETSNGTTLSLARRDKFAMIDVVKKAGLLTPLYFKSDKLVEIQKWIAEKTCYPVVIKALDSGGTDGVFICRTNLEVEQAYNKIMHKPNVYGKENYEVLVESFLEGSEYVVNSVSCKGKHKVIDIWKYRKKYLEGHGNIYDREELLDFDGNIQKALVEYAHKVLDALNIKFGPSHAEIMFTKSGPVLVEVAARISGATNIKVSQECVGHDAVNLTIDSYLDHSAFFTSYEKPNQLFKYAMVVDFATEQEGIVRNELFTEKLQNLPSLRSMLLKVKPGECLKMTRDLGSSPAKFHLVHESREQIEEDYQLIQDIGRTAFILEDQSNTEELARLWQKEYVQQGIPSSFRTEPSSVVSKFFYPFFVKNSPQKAGGGHVVDMGCGLGRNSIFFAERGFQVTALDIVPENIEQIQRYAEARNLKLTAICGDITDRIPVDDKSVDIIIDIFCYKHQVNDTKREFYRQELCRILKDDGYYLLSLAGKDDGYYGPLLRDDGSSHIVDPKTGVGSVLFNPEDIKREFSEYRIKRLQTVKKSGLMHGQEYERVTHAFIMKKDLPDNYSDSDDEIVISSTSMEMKHS